MAGEVFNVSIIIWQPRQYTPVWAIVGNDGSGRVRYRPCNSEPAAEPYHKDALIREVTRYTGWTQEYYANSGEMEITIPAGQVQPEDIARGRFVQIDGKQYEIEDYEWSLTNGGYEVTISGRDFGGRMDREIPTIRDASGVISGDMTYVEEIARAFFDSYYMNETNAAFNLPEYAGWFRDADRKPEGGWVVWQIEGEHDLGETFNAEGGGELELVSYGALLRYMMNFYDLGYRFSFVFNQEAGLFQLQMQLYRPEESGVVLHSTGRGVSGFKYALEGRDTVNAAFVCAKSRWFKALDAEAVSSEDPVYPILSLQFKQEGSNWADVANNWSGRVLDCGEVPEENDTSIDAARAWLEGQTVDIYQTPAETVEFSYDNSGPYKYGVHFGLGSKVHLVDEFLNIGLSQRLRGVKTKYEAGKAKEYEFEFGDQRRTTADKLLKRLSELDRKNYSI